MFNQVFNWDVLTFDDAIARHGMLRDCLTKLTSTNGLTRDKAKQIAAYLQDAWNECVGAGSPDSAIAAALRGIVPLDYVPLLRMRSGIPASYLIARLTDVLINAVLTNVDIDDDMLLRGLVLEAFKAFEERRKTADTLEEGFGFDRSDAWAQMRQVEDRQGEVSHLMKQVANLAGRMYKSFEYNAIPSKCKDPQEVEGVETGGEIDRMLDDEKASIGIDPDVAVRVSEDRANQFKMAGESTKSRGPLVVAVDESGSMHGHREIWAKACSVALIRVALQEGRAVRMVHFSTVTDVHDVRQNEPEDLRLVAESHCGGGTDIDVAMEVALLQVGDLEKDGKEGADIVFITDGLDSYSRHHFEQMAKMGVQLWTVAIDVDIKAVSESQRKSGGASGASGWLFDFARAYVHISDATIRGNGAGAINAALQLRESALDNVTREEEANRG